MVEASSLLPLDGVAGALVGRVWLPQSGANPGGPCVVTVRAGGVFDLTSHWPTVSDLLEETDPAACVARATGVRIGTLEAVIQATMRQDGEAPHFLAPCDLQVIKAAGVTFASSMMERVIEEQAKGNPALAAEFRARILEILDGPLEHIVPGSRQAEELKQLLVARGLWSQYLEVGIGPDAEVFTKSPLLSAVGLGADVGIHPKSIWNNPEPEIVLAVDSRGRIKGATLGNDVNLRDMEGRSALLLGKAKDNNGSCSIGPFLRLFDSTYSLEDVRRCVVIMEVHGEDGFIMKGVSSMSLISRDPLSLVTQTIGDHHQYPDGFMLFLGTMFAPVQDRGVAGSGFTHHLGDSVRIFTDKLGTLVNRVQHCDQIRPWTFGVRALYQNLAARDLLRDTRKFDQT